MAEEQHKGEVSSNLDVIAAIQEMASAIRENRNGNHQEGNEERVMRIQGEFRKARPPIFKGILDPMVAEEWLRQMKRTLNNQKVPEDLKVIVACTYLESAAYHWWESVLATPDIEITTWNAFEVVFLEKYFPDTVRQAKAKEFMFLSKGNMTVAEYQGKFEELMRFAPGIIPNEAAKAMKFEEGLNPEIREMVSILKLQKYSEVVDRALIAERSIQETKGSSNFGNTSRQYKHQDFGPMRNNFQRSSKSVEAAPYTKVCYYCRESGHLQRDCPLRQANQPPLAQFRPNQQAQFHVPQPQFRPQLQQGYAPQQYRATFQPQQNWQRPIVPQQAPRPGNPIRPTAPTGERGSTQGRLYALNEEEEENGSKVV